MKFSYAGLFLLIFVSLSASIVFAEENFLGDVPPTVIVNQEIQPVVATVESVIPVVEVDALKSAETDEDVVSAEGENDVNDRVVVEPVVPVSENIVTSVERSPFNRMKQLVGRWEGLGENTPGEKSNKIVVVYDITAGGNAVMERIFPGTSQEMVTMYYEQKGQLTLTHYCMIGTRSTMALKSLLAAENSRQNNIYDFSLVENADLDSTLDTHMNSLRVTFIDKDHMNQSWEMFEAGKPSGNYSFVLTRVADKP